MRVNRVTLANVRAIEHGEFRFLPGFNLVVGINGVGKSTVLDCLCVCLSRILPSISESRSKGRTFDVSDIRSGLPFLDVEMSLEFGDKEFRYNRRQWREQFARDDKKNIEQLRRQIMESERLRDRARNLLRDLENSDSVADTDFYTPPVATFKSEVRSSADYPFAVFFSTNRAVLSAAAASKSKANIDRVASHADALVGRPMQIRQIAEWMRVQQALAGEREEAAKHLTVLQTAISRFLPEYRNLRPSPEGKPTLLLDHQGIQLDVRQLSDGERGVLALVLDLAKRLSQAFKKVGDPLIDSEAIVLIDEIDLHLHPKWQRQIVRNLTATFPQCQFIATTHSPQVIGEVEHGRIQIIADGQVYSPPHSYGVDSNRVLEEIMNVDPRSQDVQQLLTQISTEIGAQQFQQARQTVAKLSIQLGEDDPEVIRTLTLIDFMEGKE